MSNAALDPAIIGGELVTGARGWKAEYRASAARSRALSRAVVSKLTSSALPSNCKVLSVTRHGKTNWAKGLRVEVELDGSQKAYFLKVCIASS